MTCAERYKNFKIVRRDDDYKNLLHAPEII